MSNDTTTEITALPPLEKKKTRKTPTAKQKAFAREYAKTLNGTQSALKVYKVKGNKAVNANGYHTAHQIAVENLQKPAVRQEIEMLMRANNIEVSEVFNIHRRNMLQDKHLPTSQKAVDSFHEMLGLKNSDKPSSDVKIAFIIEK